jgi:hypothetical protein
MAMFKEELVKLAGSPDITKWLGYLGMGLALSVGMGLTTAGIKAGVGAIDEWQLERDTPEMFKKVLEMHPELKEDKELALKYFKSLIHYSPHIAKDPLSAGSYIRAAIQMNPVYGGPLPEVLSTLTNIQKQHGDAKKNYPTSFGGTTTKGLEDAAKGMVPGMMAFEHWSQ